MTISMRMNLRHMAWANQKLYAAVAELPDAALSSYIVDPEWTVGRILGHLGESGHWYLYCLKLAPWKPFVMPGSMADVRGVARELAEIDAQLLSQATLGGAMITQDLGDGDHTYPRSMILAQAVHHASEHRAQLVGALEFKGYSLLKLDDLDLWCFYAEVAKQR
ncbi:MAG: DinB family protein [Candidatus Nanopelagicales bacterium]